MSRLHTLEGDELGRSFFKKLKKGVKKAANLYNMPTRIAARTAGKALKLGTKAYFDYTPGGVAMKYAAQGAGLYKPKKKKKRGTGIPGLLPASEGGNISPAMSTMQRNILNRVQRAQQQPGGGFDDQQAQAPIYDMPEAYSSQQQPGGGFDDQQAQAPIYDMQPGGGFDDSMNPGPAMEDEETSQEDEMSGYPYDMYGDGDLTSTDGTTADAHPEEAAPTVKKKKKKKGSWSKIKGGAKWAGGKVVKAGKFVGKVVLGGLDAIVIRVVKENIKLDGGVIRPDLRGRCVTQIQAAAAVAMIPAPGAIVGKLVDRAIKKLSGKYGFADYAEDAKDWITEHKYIVIGGALAVAFLLYNKKNKGRRRG